MIRNLLILLTSIVLVSCVHMAQGGSKQAPAEIRGVLTGETVLQGYVTLVGDVLIPKGSILTIRPGTTLFVRDSESTKIDPEYLSAQTELLVRGTLIIARDEKGGPVTFAPEKPTATAEPAWAGIILDHATKSVIQNSSINQADTGILIINASPEISGNKINRSRYGVIIQGGSPRIVANEITGGESGIFCWNGTRAYLKNNRIIDNNEEGLFVDRESRPYFTQNRVKGNDVGLVAAVKELFDPSLMQGNRQDFLLLESVPGEAK